MEATHILSVDPGNVQSAYTMIEAGGLRPVAAGKLGNGELLRVIEGLQDKGRTRFVVEMVASYGMAVGATVFDTVFWLGRFYEAARGYQSRDRVYRMEVKINLCHNSRAKDTNIRQALIDRFGVVGTKKAPGWFYGFKSDIWAAYAVGVTYADKSKAAQSGSGPLGGPGVCLENH